MHGFARAAIATYYRPGAYTTEMHFLTALGAGGQDHGVGRLGFLLSLSPGLVDSHFS